MEAPVISELGMSPKSLKGGTISKPVTDREKFTVKFTFAALVGLGSARRIEETVGKAGGTNSYAPTSGALPVKSSLMPGIKTPRSIFGLEERRVKSPARGFVNPGGVSYPLHSSFVAVHNFAMLR
jgi:hypothetical protein